MCVFRSGFWGTAQPPTHPCPGYKRDPPCSPEPTFAHPILTLQILPGKHLALPHLGCGAPSWSGTQATKAQDLLMKSLTQTQKTWTPTGKSCTQFLKTQKTSTLSLKTWIPATKIWNPSPMI